MIRLLTAALLFASFHAVADTEVPHTFTDGTAAKASEVNDNFDALEAAIDASPADAVEAVTSADLDMNGNRVLFSNVYSQLADLPSASANHGMFAHVHETGEAYYAHAGEWIQIAKQSSVIAAGLSCTTDQSIVYRDGAWVCSSPERVAGSFFEQGFRTVYCSDGKKVTGGGCQIGGPGGCDITGSYPLEGLSGWRCFASGDECVVESAYAICQ